MDQSHTNPSLLYVDLDGTLVASDLLHEATLRLLRAAPLQIIHLPFLLLEGKAKLKRYIAERVEIDVATLPYREEVVNFIRAAKANGSRVVLATASDERMASAVAAHLGLFDGVIASDGENNLSGNAKLRAIKYDAAGAPFIYMGDQRLDLPVWAGSTGAVVVSSSKRLLTQAAKRTEIKKVIPAPAATLRDYLYGIRLHQWLKNLLVALPLLPLWNSATEAMKVNTLLAFVAFGLSASAIYVVNDLLDLESDRRHHRKQNRPFAAGRIDIVRALILSFGLLVGSWAVAVALLAPLFSVVLALYIGLTTAYSFTLKRRILADVFTLAGLYTMRIFAGAAAINVMPSFWILSFSLFAFLSLALAKRYVEIDSAKETGGVRIRERGYLVSDQGFVLTCGIGAGQVSALVLSLYLNDPMISQRYTYPHLLWAINPLYLYWIIRVWLKARRGELHDDPIVFAARDRISRWVAILSLIVVGIAV